MIVGSKRVQRLRLFSEYVRQGVQTFYSTFPPKLREETLSFAEKYDLYVTAGSDYHGKNKFIALGKTNLDKAKEIPGGMKRFLEAVDYS